MSKHEKAIAKLRDEILRPPLSELIDKDSEEVVQPNEFYKMLGGLRYRIRGGDLWLSVEHNSADDFNVFITRGDSGSSMTEIATSVKFKNLARELPFLIRDVLQRP